MPHGMMSLAIKCLHPCADNINWLGSGRCDQAGSNASHYFTRIGKNVPHFNSQGAI
eukprot:CAMPEP_0172660468 /NCGR_PEP_ID=MMETSP1074-20121228/4083_1 /TAXON_ID=2916 /ORGANISM="Ceratium fusus, Strain PA161109" /LENGTH=55 /DNA_ID=CAMNT_0013476087 /DNA_START=139 /DNA_END=306 /DNA_ORIENTATION=-